MGPAVTKAVVEAGSEGQPTQVDVREVQPASYGAVWSTLVLWHSLVRHCSSVPAAQVSVPVVGSC